MKSFSIRKLTNPGQAKGATAGADLTNEAAKNGMKGVGASTSAAH